MDAATDPLDLSYQLAGDVYRLVVHTLRGLLPPPEDDTPEAEALRDRAAITRVAAMLPANADEADIAARAVAHAAYGQHCLRLARRFCDTDQAWFMKCCAMSNAMERRAEGARALLARLQAERRKREKDMHETDRAAWTEHCALGLMAQELGLTPPAPMPEPPPPALEPEPAAPLTGLAAEADLYAVMYPKRAALIRELGGLPDPCTFGPPSPELVRAIATGATPHLLELDAERVT